MDRTANQRAASSPRRTPPAAPSLHRLASLALVGAVLAGCGGGTATKADIPGLETFSDLSRNHVSTPVDYPQRPPVGGDHAPIWQTCGPYDEPLTDELAVHSMEHGAVWITYRPDLPGSEVDHLRRAARRPYVLVSPYPGLTSAVVASAWGRQLRLDSASDARLEQFVSSFSNGPQTPEPGASCTGQGTPLPQAP